MLHDNEGSGAGKRLTFASYPVSFARCWQAFTLNE